MFNIFHIRVYSKWSFFKRDPTLETKLALAGTQQRRTQNLAPKKDARKRPSSDFQIAMSGATDLTTPLNNFLTHLRLCWQNI